MSDFTDGGYYSAFDQNDYDFSDVGNSMDNWDPVYFNDQSYTPVVMALSNGLDSGSFAPGYDAKPLSGGLDSGSVSPDNDGKNLAGQPRDNTADKNWIEKTFDFLNNPSHEKTTTAIFGAAGALGKAYIDEHSQKLKSQLQLNESKAAADRVAAATDKTNQFTLTHEASQNAFTLQHDAAQAQLNADKDARIQAANDKTAKDSRDAQAAEAEKQRQFLAQQNEANRANNVTLAGINSGHAATPSYSTSNVTPNYASVPAYAPGSVLNAAQFIRN